MKPYRLPDTGLVGRRVMVHARWDPLAFAVMSDGWLYLGPVPAAHVWRERGQWHVQVAPHIKPGGACATFGTVADMMAYLEKKLLLQEDELPGVPR